MEIVRAIEQGLRSDPGLMADIEKMVIRHRAGRRSKECASTTFIRDFVNRDRDGARLYCFFEEFRNRHGWNQMQCPKRYFLTALRTLMEEVTSHA